MTNFYMIQGDKHGQSLLGYNMLTYMLVITLLKLLIGTTARVQQNDNMTRQGVLTC